MSDRRTFQRVFEEATARWSGGEHDEEYDEPWPAFLGSDPGRARPGVRPRGADDRGHLRRPDRRGLRPARRPGDDTSARLWTSFNTVTANASVTRVLEGSPGRRLLSFNEHSHLPRDLVTYR